MFLPDNPTQQQVFDHVLVFLTEQGPCYEYDDGGSKHPKYRDSGGLMCAVGCCIPYEVYDPIIEDKSLKELKALDLLQGSLRWMTEGEMFPFMKKLQSAHDNYLMARGVDEWLDRMKSIAQEHSLTFPKLKKE